MMASKPVKILISTVLICGTLYGAVHYFYPSGSWRYKLTVTVETPEGIKTGSAVREVHAQEQPHPLPEMKPTAYSIKGEAAVVDLGKRGQLFALLPTYIGGSDGWRSIVFAAFPTNLKGRQRINYYQSLTGQSKELDPSHYPVMVHFKDPQDPKTVESLLEYKPCPDEKGIPRNSRCITDDHFAEFFGEGVRLKSVSIEMTDEPVTKGLVQKYLPTYQPIEAYMQWFKSLEYSDPRRLLPSNFGAIGQ